MKLPSIIALACGFAFASAAAITVAERTGEDCPGFDCGNKLWKGKRGEENADWVGFDCGNKLWKEKRGDENADCAGLDCGNKLWKH